jgi:transcriptional regulator with XRE-family HTH domain
LDKRHPKQNTNNSKTFGTLLKGYLKDRHMTQQMLADRTGLSRTTIGRMITNKDNRGGTYHTSEEAVVLICLALDLGLDQSKELYFAAFPERQIWWECIANRNTIEDAAEKLLEAQLPMIGNSVEE